MRSQPKRNVGAAGLPLYHTRKCGEGDGNDAAQPIRQGLTGWLRMPQARGQTRGKRGCAQLLRIALQAQAGFGREAGMARATDFPEWTVGAIREIRA
jgi:hypothetical protein